MSSYSTGTSSTFSYGIASICIG